MPCVVSFCCTIVILWCTFHNLYIQSHSWVYVPFNLDQTSAPHIVNYHLKSPTWTPWLEIWVRSKHHNYNDDIGGSWRRKSQKKRLVVQQPVQVDIKETSKLRIQRNPPVTGGFPSQRPSSAENVSISWRHQDMSALKHLYFRQLHLLLTARGVKCKYRFMLSDEISTARVESFVSTIWRII